MEELKWPEITKDTPMEEVKRIHQRIWDYVIEHGKKPDTPYTVDCAACTYITLQREQCNDCPILWPKNNRGDRICCINDGIYNQWRHATGKEKTELARQIRDLPWKFESEENTPL